MVIFTLLRSYEGTSEGTFVLFNVTDKSVTAGCAIEIQNAKAFYYEFIGNNLYRYPYLSCQNSF